MLVLGGAAVHFAGAQSSQSEYSEAMRFLQKNRVKLPGKKFQPNKLVSRAEFLAMLFPTFYYEKPVGKNCFPDVKTQWFAKFVCQAQKMNIVNARADGNFQPNEPVRFIEAARIISEAIFIHTGDLRGYAKNLVGRRAIPLSIKSFEQNLTRGEAAEILRRFATGITYDPSLESRTFDEIQAWPEPPSSSVAPPDESSTPPAGSFNPPTRSSPFPPPLPPPFVEPVGKYPYSKMSKNFKSYFEDDPIAEAILKGEMDIDLFNYDPAGCYGQNIAPVDPRIVPVVWPVGEPYIAKILHGLRQLGYDVDMICGQHKFMKGVLLFQREHGLPYSNIVDAKMLKTLADELKKIEERDREAAKNFTCYEFMAPTPYNDVSKEHLAYLFKTAIDVFPERLRIKKKDCVNEQTFSISQEKKLICDSGYFLQYAPGCNLLKFQTSNSMGRSDYTEMATIMHEYSHFIDSYAGYLDTTGFYNISYDVSDPFEDTYRWRPTKPIFSDDGKDHSDDPAWNEMKQHFFSYAEGWQSVEKPGYATPFEDFAVSVTMYVLHGETFRDYMKDKPPMKKKYNWLKKNVFDGKEFYTGDREYRKYAPDLYSIDGGIWAADGYITIRPLFKWDHMQPADVKKDAPVLSFEEAGVIDKEIEAALQTLMEKESF